MENRTDCDSFEVKQHKHQRGDCQTDGHYLCSNCKHISSFEEMELSDNVSKYYPSEFEKEINSLTQTTNNGE